MKQLFGTLSTVVFVVCAGLLVYMFAGRDIRLVKPNEAEASPKTASLERPPGQPLQVQLNQRQQVDFAVDEVSFDDFTDREREDQYRDWLLFTSVAALQPSAEEYNRTLFDLPASRQGYMRPVGSFEFGETRSRYIGDGRVLALIPAARTPSERKDFLALIADEQRKNLGGRFERLIIVEYELDSKQARAAITRREEIDYATLFSTEYGYFEQPVTGLADFEEFMKAVPELTFARKTPDGLLLGGRQLLSRKYRSIAVEQVATVWQAERTIQKSLADWDARMRKAQADFNARSMFRTYLSEFERDRDLRQIQAQLALERRNLKLVNGSGFSLDPAIDYVDLKQKFERLGSGLKQFPSDMRFDEQAKATALALAKGDMRPLRQLAVRMSVEYPHAADLLEAMEKAAVHQASQSGHAGLNRSFEKLWSGLKQIPSNSLSDETATVVALALAKEDIRPLRQAVARMRTENPIVAELLDRTEKRTSYQAARYDGALQGTEAGMILFYTDLLAKLWTIDYAESSPSRGKISGFLDDPSVFNSEIYAAERKKFTNARLWFGHSNLGFQIADQKESVLLARNATRIYSAGSEAVEPGVEGEASAFLAAALDWWNDHYIEVARYEPEYERLNQIMKWSIIVGWLNELNEGDKLGFLAGVSVDRSKVFPEWVLRHPELKFLQWDKIGFFPAGYKGNRTETLPLLRGPVTRGGVSLANKEVVKRAPLPSGMEKLIQRSNLDYAEISGKDSLKTLDGTIFNLSRTDSNTATVVARAKPSAKFRATTAQLAPSGVERAVIAGADGIRVETRASGVPIGDLEIGRSKNGFTVGWRAREIDRAHGLARELSVSPEPDLLLLRDPVVETVVKLPGDATYAVKLKDSSQWVKFEPERQPSVDIAAGWQLRAAAGQGKAVRNMQAAVINEAQLSEVVKSHIVIEALNDGKPLLRAAADAGPGGSRVIEIDVGGGTRLSAWVQPPSEAVHLSVKGGNSADAVRIVRRLGPEDIDAIRKAAANENSPVLRLSDQSQVRAKLATELHNRDFRKAAAEIAGDPATARRALDAQIKIDLQHNASLLAEKGPNEALRDLDRLIAVYGKQPDFMLRRGLVQIERGNIAGAAESVQMKTVAPLKDRQGFFDEVNARFRTGSREANADRYRYAEYVDWTDRIARSPAGERGGSVQLAARENRFDLEYRLSTAPADRPVTLAELGDPRSRNAVVYRQDHVSLNALDWANSVDQSLRLVVSGRFGKVVRLPQDIAQYRPSVVWSPDNAIPFKAAQAQAHTPNFSPTGYQACNPIAGSCANDNNSDQSPRDVYLVTAN